MQDPGCCPSGAELLEVWTPPRPPVVPRSLLLSPGHTQLISHLMVGGNLKRDAIGHHADRTTADCGDRAAPPAGRIETVTHRWMPADHVDGPVDLVDRLASRGGHARERAWPARTSQRSQPSISKGSVLERGVS